MVIVGWYKGTNSRCTIGKNSAFILLSYINSTTGKPTVGDSKYLFREIVQLINEKDGLHSNITSYQAYLLAEGGMSIRGTDTTKRETATWYVSLIEHEKPLESSLIKKKKKGHT